MSESHRDYNKSSNISSTETRGNSKDDNEQYHRKRTHDSQKIENLDAKVYVGNIPTEKVTDNELLDFFKPFGKVSDIRVFKDYIFVQYNRADDARTLINEGQIPLIFKGNKLDILPAREAPSNDKANYHKRNPHRHSSDYEPSRKRFHDHERPNFNHETNRIDMEMNDRMYLSSSRSCSRQSSNDSGSRIQQTCYSILTGPKNPTELVDCQIIIVNVRQREYAEEIESRLASHGLIASVILLREDYTLIQAIENATRQHCLYGIIAMPMHEERRTASFHILYGQTEEHRNLTLEDGYHIIINNFISYKESLHNAEVNSYRENNESMIYPEPLQSYEYIHPSDNISQEEINPPVLTLADKLPLSMLLCLLSDGRQLTLDEIDRVLVYLLEKKAKMLTLPIGTLPPLPVQYATMTALNHQTGSGTGSDTRPTSTSDASSSSSIAEQIRQILSTNIVKPPSSIEETTTQHVPPTKTSLETLPNSVKIEDKVISHSHNNAKEAPKEYVQYQQRQAQTQAQNMAQQQQKTHTSFPYPKTELAPVAPPAFNYPLPSVSTTGPVPSFSSYNSATPSLTLNSSLKPTTISNFVTPTSQYFYQVPSQNIYQSPLNSTGVDAAAALFQAYSQFNVPPTSTPAFVSQQIISQQQQIKK